MGRYVWICEKQRNKKRVLTSIPVCRIMSLQTKQRQENKRKQKRKNAQKRKRIMYKKTYNGVKVTKEKYDGKVAGVQK